MGASQCRLSDTVAAKALPSANALNGKVALITGPTSGIGFETARVLAKHGAHVILAARDAKKTATVQARLVEEIKAELPDANPQFTALSLNLSSLTSVRAAVQQFLSLGLPLHFLVNNAGVMALPYSHTEEGIEAQIGTNHIGHYYLTRLLLPKLRASGTSEFPARVVNVASVAHGTSSIKTPEDLAAAFTVSASKYGPYVSYGHSKLANILHARYIGESESAAGHHVLAYSVHPGVVSTDLGRTNTGAKIFYAVGSIFMKNTNQGASTTVHCLLAATPAESGRYFADNKVSKCRPQATDPALQAKLIEVSERYIQEFESKGVAATSSAVPPTEASVTSASTGAVQVTA